MERELLEIDHFCDYWFKFFVFIKLVKVMQWVVICH